MGDDRTGQDEPPTKRVKISNENTSPLDTSHNLNKEVQKEIKCGIETFVCPNALGFTGIFKQRFTDFIVNEILPCGTVLHLQNIATASKTQLITYEGFRKEDVSEMPHQTGDSGERPEKSSETINGQISSKDRAELIKIFGEKITTSVVHLYENILKYPLRKRKMLGVVKSDSIAEKDDRTKAHAAIRRIFKSKLETTTGEEDKISISKSIVNSSKSRTAGEALEVGWSDWPRSGGTYLYFTLYKENKDTMEAIQFLSTQLKLGTKSFGFAGTKDRRAVTTQRMSVMKVHPARLVGLAKNLKGVTIGDIEYAVQKLDLGSLHGNEFVITLRNCRFPGEEELRFDEREALASKIVAEAGRNLVNHGFVNFYGLQRFGTFSVSTDEVGKALLKENMKLAVDLILSFDQESLEAAQNENDTSNIPRDDKQRALAIHIWKTTHDSHKALDLMPRKFSAEISLIRHLGLRKQGKSVNEHDYQGALSNIQRNLRLMYVHSYQSLVWNMMADERLRTYGSQVVEGDLVRILVNQPDTAAVDQTGEVIINPNAEGGVYRGTNILKARPLSAEEASSGLFSISDIVLPLPGWDVEYPKNAIREAYVKFMASERGGGLDPYDMKRKWKDISLTGGYRHVFAKAKSLEWCIKPYAVENQQLVETDMDRINGTRINDDSDLSSEQADKLAVILTMKLGSSTYATIALREMLKLGGLRSFTAEFSK